MYIVQVYLFVSKPNENMPNDTISILLTNKTKAEQNKTVTHVYTIKWCYCYRT